VENQRFDRFARAVSACTSRRQALRLLAVAAVAGWLPRSGAAAPARQAGCAAGLTDCYGVCVDLLTDLNNCGACGSVCESGLVPVRCRDGVCERASCPVGIEFCGAVDGCRDLSSDPLHCGACQNACASGVCTGGVCAPADGGACAPGQTDCGGVCVDTCCDNNNCGACGNVCTGGLTCFEGVCDCPSGNCGPITLPNTGSGSSPSDHRPWLAPTALAGAAAALAAALRRLTPRPQDD
jgi:hypothetical protein